MTKKDADTKDPETYTIIGAAMKVHRELGFGFLEAVYQEAFEKELQIQSIPYKKEVESPIFYRGERLNTFYKALLINFGAEHLYYKRIVFNLRESA